MATHESKQSPRGINHRAGGPARIQSATKRANGQSRKAVNRAADDRANREYAAAVREGQQSARELLQSIAADAVMVGSGFSHSFVDHPADAPLGFGVGFWSVLEVALHRAATGAAETPRDDRRPVASARLRLVVSNER